ncbi:MAG: ABC transporter substrate-binding protein [Lysobacterales bacterium]|nr:MAG: ABC transporter substrate-binding protein [Xanthomonadales bacterium]
MRKLACIALVFLLGAANARAYAIDERDPLTIIEETTAQILETLNARREEFTADPGQLRAIVREELLPLIDLEYSARLILGKAGRGVGAEQLSAFSNAMSDVLINRYSDGLLEFRSDEQVEVLPLKGNNTEKLTRIRTRIKLENGGFAPVDYSFRKTANGWKAFDVMVEGISYVITFRNQIAPRVEAEGIDKVTTDILAGNLRIEEDGSGERDAAQDQP